MPDATGPQSLRDLALAAGALLLVILALGFSAPLPQDPAYHDFADAREFAGIANFWNVVSNLPFLLVGVAGLAQLRRLPPGAQDLRPAYQCFFAGVLLTSAGSAAYHLAPSSPSLVWDRLPMTVAFAGLVGLAAGIYVERRYARAAMLAWLALGVSGVLAWAVGESRGAGDLRLYAIAQFVPLVLFPLLALRRDRRNALDACFAWLFAAYLLAKLAEGFDAGIYAATGFGGHALKHLIAALGTAAMVVAIPRTPVR